MSQKGSQSACQWRVKTETLQDNTSPQRTPSSVPRGLLRFLTPQGKGNCYQVSIQNTVHAQPSYRSNNKASVDAGDRLRSQLSDILPCTYLFIYLGGGGVGLGLASLYSRGCAGTHKDPPAPAFQELGLKIVCHHTWLFIIFKN